MTDKHIGRPKTGGTPIRSIRVPDAEWHAWEQAAQAKGKSRTEWIRDLANAEVQKITDKVSANS